MMDAVDVAAQQMQEISGKFPNCPVEVLDDGALLWRVAQQTRVRILNMDLGVEGREGVLFDCNRFGDCGVRLDSGHPVYTTWKNLRIIPGAGKQRQRRGGHVQTKPLPEQLRQRARQLVGDGYDIEFVKPLVEAAAALGAK